MAQDTQKLAADSLQCEVGRAKHAGSLRHGPCSLRTMQFAKFSGCGRFVVLEGLNLDRVVFEELDRWAREHGLRAQDAIQVAICAFNERCEVKLPHVSASRVRPPLSDRIE